MSIEIYYFSGTGNSYYIAKGLQERIPDSKIIPMAGLMDKTTISAKGKTIGFVFPVHALTIPLAVKKFIKKVEMNSTEYVFAVATREGSIFRGFKKIDQLLSKKKKKLNSHFILNMPLNDPRREDFKNPVKTEIHEFEKVIQNKMDDIANTVVKKNNNREKDSAYLFKVSNNPVSGYLLEKIILFCMNISEYTGGVNYFYTETKCNGCGICEKVCLSKKIKITNNKPIWRKNVLCYMCFACLNYCPKKCVQIKDITGVKSYTKENGRYSHPYATVKDISMQKEHKYSSN